MPSRRLAFCVLIAVLARAEAALSGTGANQAIGAADPRSAQAERQDAGAINGRVVDARTGAGLGKVLVLIEDGGPSARTDDTGAFHLPRVEAGPRRLYVSVVGYSLVRRDVRIEPGGALTLTIPLSEGTGTYTE